MIFDGNLQRNWMKHVSSDRRIEQKQDISQVHVSSWAGRGAKINKQAGCSLSGACWNLATTRDKIRIQKPVARIVIVTCDKTEAPCY